MPTFGGGNRTKLAPGIIPEGSVAPSVGVFQKNALQVWASRVLGSFLPRCLDGKRGRPWYCGLAAMRRWKEERAVVK